MKQAKYHTQDLNKTNDFMSHLVSRDGLEKERSRPSPIEAPLPGRQVNGRPKMHRNDSHPRFSDPPAPPPQQPLPEKPDVASRSNLPSAVIGSPLKRSEAEKSRSPANSIRESSQILSLIEALAAAKKELDLQGARVRELEDLLRHERIARETAEERARKLESERPEQAIIEMLPEVPLDDDDDSMSVTTVVEPLDGADAETADSIGSHDGPPPLPSTANELQLRFDALLAEMGEMRKEVDKYKNSAEQAETDAAQSRKTLAEMIEQVRRERSEKVTRNSGKSEATPSGTPAEVRPSNEKEGEAIKDEVTEALMMRCRPLSPTRMQELEQASIAFAKAHKKPSLFEQSAPYASMIGVVLIGVGIMAYLNGWQKGDR